MSTSIKQRPIKDLTATTGGNLTIDTGDFTFGSGVPNDSYILYRLTGSPTLSSDLDIVASGTLHKNIVIEMINEASITAAGNDVTFFGTIIPEEMHSSPFKATAMCDGSSWTTNISPDWASGSLVNTDRLEDGAVTEAKLANDAVTLAKLAGGTTSYFITFDGSGNPTAVDIIGDITIDETGASVIGASKVLNAMIASGLDAAKLTTGTIPIARLGTGKVTHNELANTTILATDYTNHATSAVTTEEVLWSHTMNADQLGADGQGVRIVASGYTAANANNKTLRFKVDGNAIVTNTTTAAPNNKRWRIEAVVIRSGATASVSEGVMKISDIADELKSNKAGITWANAIDVEVTGQNGTAAANDIVLESITLEYLK